MVIAQTILIFDVKSNKSLKIIYLPKSTLLILIVPSNRI